nr:hypothetical protein PanWU01x14_244710 [Ipomoea batatas]
MKPKKPEALTGQNRTSGMPSSSAASRVKLITPSATMHDTGGTLDAAVSLSRARRPLKGHKQVVAVDAQREAISWVASASEGGRPSGMVSNRNDGRPRRDSGPLDLSRRRWLNSVFTKVM